MFILFNLMLSLSKLPTALLQDDKLTILATLFWVGASLLESDYEHEFLLGVRLLARVMSRLPLDRPDARERLDRTQAHTSPSLHALLLKVRNQFKITKSDIITNV